MACTLLTDVDGEPVPLGQDGHVGRDVTYNDDSDGHAGFSFTKIGADGRVLTRQDQVWSETGSEAAGTHWSCVKDNVTGLVWEVKQGKPENRDGDAGLHDADDLYTWYRSNPQANGGSVGFADRSIHSEGGLCYGYDKTDSRTYCNTEAYVNRVNAAGWCGASDWRLPMLNELLSIVDLSRKEPAIDVDYFPNIHAMPYLSGTPYDYDQAAKHISFDAGTEGFVAYSVANHVLLVRSSK